MKILVSYFLAVMLFILYRTLVPYMSFGDSVGTGIIISALSYLVISGVWEK